MRLRLRILALIAVVLFTAGLRQAHAQGADSGGQYFPYDENYGVEQGTYLDIDDDLNLDAFTESVAYLGDEAYDGSNEVYDNFTLIAEITVNVDGSFMDYNDGNAQFEAIAECFDSVSLGHTYGADGESSILIDNEGYLGEGDNIIFLGEIWTSVATGPPAPYVDHADPALGTIGANNAALTFYGYDLLNSDGSGPSFTTDPSGLSITLDTSQTSTSTTVYALYSVASTQTPNYGLIDLNTDGGTSNDVDFQLGYPDASNIVVTPSVWPAGQTTNITITGTNMGTSPSAYVNPFDITYSNQMVQADGSITATVSVPADTTDTSATVYVDPGYTGCTGSCFTSNDPSDSSGQAGSAPVGITPATPSISCTSQVTRGQTVTCTGSPSGRTFTNWTFTDGTNTVGPVSGTTSTTWSGIAVASGTVTAVANGVTVSASLTVTARSGWAFTAASPAQVASNSITCYDGTMKELQSPPVNDMQGASCPDQNFYFQLAASISSGPNAGYQYVSSAMSRNSDGTMPTQYQFIVVSDLLSSTDFFSAQCGNFSSSNASGFIAGTQLKLNVFDHEQGSILSHWTEYRDAQNLSSNNIGTVLESQVGSPGTTPEAFQSQVTDAGTAALNRIETAAGTEPCGGSAIEDSSQSCKSCGALNLQLPGSPYASCGGAQPVAYCQ